jgi:hypothetical protein
MSTQEGVIMVPRENLGARLVRRLRNCEARHFSRARREHDFVMSDRRLAVEHQNQVAHALDCGERGCTFCR